MWGTGKRHNLKPVIAMNLDATMNHLAGKYQGLELRISCDDAYLQAKSKSIRTSSPAWSGSRP